MMHCRALQFSERVGTHVDSRRSWYQETSIQYEPEQRAERAAKQASEGEKTISPLPQRRCNVVLPSGVVAPLDNASYATMGPDCRMCHFSGCDIALNCGCSLHAVSDRGFTNFRPGATKFRSICSGAEGHVGEGLSRSWTALCTTGTASDGAGHG